MSQLILTRSPNSSVLNLIFLDLDNVCRLCLTSSEISLLEDISVLKSFSTVACVEVKLDDQHRKMLCAKCSEQMKQTTQFISQCRLTQTLLKSVVTVPKSTGTPTTSAQIKSPLINVESALSTTPVRKPPDITSPPQIHKPSSSTTNATIPTNVLGGGLIKVTKTANTMPIISNTSEISTNGAFRKKPVAAFKSPAAQLPRKDTSAALSTASKPVIATYSNTKKKGKFQMMAKQKQIEYPASLNKEVTIISKLEKSPTVNKEVINKKAKKNKTSQQDESFTMESPFPDDDLTDVRSPGTSESDVRANYYTQIINTPIKKKYVDEDSYEDPACLCERCGIVVSDFCKHNNHQCPKCNFVTCLQYLLEEHNQAEHLQQHPSDRDIAVSSPIDFNEDDSTFTKIFGTTDEPIQQISALDEKEQPSPVEYTFIRNAHLMKKCEGCNLSFICLNKHRKENKKCWLKCSQCTYTNWKNSAVKAHQIAKHTNISWSCSDCGTTFKYKSNLTRHKKVHLNGKVYDCKICGKRFVNQSNLDEHLNSHNGLKPHLCVHCGRSFTTNGQKQTHISRYHNKGETKAKTCHVLKRKINDYLCWYCGKHFQNYNAYYHHMYLHKTVKNFLCEWCSFRTSSYHILKLHKKTHNKEFMEAGYKCPICSKSFKLRRNFEHHCKTHENPAESVQLDKKETVGNPSRMECIFSCKLCKISFSEDIERKLHAQFCTGSIEVKLVNKK